MFLLLFLFLDLERDLTLFLDLERILTLSLGFERVLILFLVLDFFCFKESLLGIYYNHIKKNFGSPLKNARNSDKVDCDDQSQDISLAPGQFLVIT